MRRYKIKYKMLNLYQKKKKLNFDVARTKDRLSLSIHLVDHCNLNCAYCTHFAPLADSSFISLETFENDIRRLADLFKNKFERIYLLGGEPFLHPELKKIILIARKYTNAEIVITTNGTLVKKSSKELIDAIISSKSKIQISNYPIEFDYCSLFEFLEEHNIEYYMATDPNDKEKYMSKCSLDLSGSQNPVKSFLKCGFANQSCAQIVDGKIYSCCISANIKYFEKEFNKSFVGVNRNYINIYDDVTADDVMTFLSLPVPMCKYCDVDNYIHGLDWRVSNKNISEWV